ncbi:MAG: hypothetical protein L3V56_02010 [Candidatus Magnetoovum sp. WYHC-5]|nr:hypothetical protein [Candidatus Magnetoovum sp. WYHC-5]
MRQVKLNTNNKSTTIYSINHVKAWAIFFISCLILLIGRYDWSKPLWEYSLRGYLSSAYMFIFFMPTLYYIICYYTKNTQLARYITLASAIICTIPYRWLYIDSLYYHKERPAFWQSQTPDVAYPAALDWLPGALLNLKSMPFEILFFTLITLLVTSMLFFYIHRKAKNQRTDLIRKLTPWFMLFLLIMLQTWLHISMRSPYSYVPHYERPPQMNYFYTVPLFPNGQGRVNEDYFVFRDLEEHFMGVPKVTNTMLIRRPLTFYISSQFSYFINPYYVFLALNMLVWFFACVAIYGYCAAIMKDGKKIGKYAALLTGCGSGFIMYAAQPMNYLTGYAAIILSLYIFETLIIQNENTKTPHYILFGVLLGLLSLIYDIYSIYIYFLIYPLLVRKKPIHNVIFSIIIAVLVFYGFIVLQQHVLNLTLKQENSGFIAMAIANISQFLNNPNFPEFYQLTTYTLSIFFSSLNKAFLILPFVIALAGAFFIRQKETAITIMIILLASYLNIAFLTYGKVLWSGVFLSSLPRFVYTAYPAIYLLCGILLYEIKTHLHQTVGDIFTWVAIVLVFLVNNIDALGYPQLYYYFYWPQGGFF